MVQELCDKELEIHHHNQIRIIILMMESAKKQQAAKEFQKPIIRKFEKHKICSSFRDKFGVLILQICNYVS